MVCVRQFMQHQHWHALVLSGENVDVGKFYTLNQFWIATLFDQPVRAGVVFRSGAYALVSWRKPDGNIPHDSERCFRQNVGQMPQLLLDQLDGGSGFFRLCFLQFVTDAYRPSDEVLIAVALDACTRIVGANEFGFQLSTQPILDGGIFP